MAEFRVLNENPGRKTQGNPVSLPPGSVLDAINFETVRENLYRVNRGREIYGTGLPTANIQQILEYQDRVFLHFDNDTIYYDSDGNGTFVQVPGTFYSPDPDYLIKSIETNSNLYFAEYYGIKKLDSLTGTPRNAGIEKALGFELRLVDTTNFLSTGKTCAYRVNWTYTDSNNNLITGAPSDRGTISNNTGVDMSVELRIQIIPEATTAYTMSIYRSSQVTGTPIEDLQLVYQASPTSAEITQGVMTVIDVTPDSFRADALYTNTTVEGIAKAKVIPPKAYSVDNYLGHTLYANIQNLQRLYTDMISVNNFTLGTSYINIFDSTYTPVSVTATANSSGLIKITTGTVHNLSTNNYVYIYGVTGTTEANGSWKVTYVDDTHFTLQGSTYANAWVSGGTVAKALNISCQRYDTNVGGDGIGLNDGIIGAVNNGSGLIRLQTKNAHNLTTGAYIRVAGVTGVEAANGCWLVTVIDSTHLDLQGSSYSGNTDVSGYIDIVTNRGYGIINFTDNGSGNTRITTMQRHGLSVNSFVRIYDNSGTVISNGVYRITTVGTTTFDINLAYTVPATTVISTNTTVSSGYNTVTSPRLEIQAGVKYEIAAGATVELYSQGKAFCDLYERIAGDNGNSLLFFVHTEGTDAQNIDFSARSFVRTLNLAQNNNFMNAYYISGYNDVVGKVEIDARTMGQSAIYMQADSTATGGNFAPIIPISGALYTSSDDIFQNAFMYSELNEPEAVPLSNIEYVGSKSDPIYAVIALRDSVYFIKQKDGIYKMTGSDPNNFNITVFDNTVQCLAIHSIVRGDNSIFMYSNQGYVKFDDSGVEQLRDNLYLDLLPSRNANIGTTYGWFYQTENQYLVSTHTDTSSTDNDIVNVYHTQTQSWRQKQHGIYTNDTNVRCARVIGNVEYSAPLTGNVLLKERKNFATSDLASPDVDVTITAIDSVNNIITISTNINVPLESKLQQGNYSIPVIAKITSAQWQLSTVNNLITGAATFKCGIYATLTYQQCHCGMPEYTKDFHWFNLFFDNAETEITNILVNTKTDTDNIYAETAKLSDLSLRGWSGVWGGLWGTKKRTGRWLFETNLDHQRATYIYLQIIHRVPEEQCAIAGYSTIFDVSSERTESGSR